MLTNYYLLVVFLPYLTKIELSVAFPPDFDIPLSIFFSGFEPWKITHASDNFGKLYDFAVELIKR